MTKDQGQVTKDKLPAEPPSQRTFRPRLIFYHPSPKGTGAALQLDLRLNGAGEDRYDCFFLEMANQKQAAAEGEKGRRHASFDWEKKVTVKMGFSDVCELLTVLEGRREQAGNGQQGMYHQTTDTNTLISFRRSAEQGTYLLNVSKRKSDGAQLFKGFIALSEAEAVGLRAVFQSSLVLLAFGRAAVA